MRLGALAGGVDGGVLQQQHGAGSTLDHLGVHLALALPRLEVVDGLLAQRLEDQFAHLTRLTRRTQPVDNRPRPSRSQAGWPHADSRCPAPAGLAVRTGSSSSCPARRGGAPPRPTRSELVDALEVLHEWDVRRARAWARADLDALRALYVRGSGAGRADVRLLRAYRARGLVVRRLVTQVFAVRVLRSDGACPPGAGLRPGGRGRGARSRRGGAVAQQPAGDEDDHLPPRRRDLAGGRGQRLGSRPSRSTALTSGSLKS